MLRTRRGGRRRAAMGRTRPSLGLNQSRCRASRGLSAQAQSASGGWAQGRTFSVDGLQPGVKLNNCDSKSRSGQRRPTAGPGAAGHSNRGFAEPQGGGRRAELSERAGQKMAGDSQGGDNPLGCVLCLLSVASQKVGAPAARAGERKKLYSPREGRACESKPVVVQPVNCDP